MSASGLTLRLPPELMSEIFLYCLPDTDFVAPDPATAPLILCGICQRWTDISLATPKLWSSLHLNFNRFRKAPDSSETDAVEFFSRWIRNARNLPLSIELCPPPREGPTPADNTPICKEDAREVVSMVRERAAQWRNVHFEWSGNYPIIVHDIIPAEGRFPRLQKLDIKGVRFWKLSHLCELLGGMDVLHELHLDDFHFRFNALGLLTVHQWAKLTTFSCKSIQFSPCIDVLQFALNLVNCTFHLEADIEEADIPDSVSSNLSVLSLRENRANDRALPLALLRLSTLPSLKRLLLHFEEDLVWSPQAHPVPGFSPFAAQFSHQLSELSLHLMRVTEETLVECLASVPSVVKLTLHPPPIFQIGEIFRQLSSDLGLLPNLMFFHAEVRREWNDLPPVWDIVDMLCARARRADGSTGIGLRSFRLSYLSDSDYIIMREQIKEDSRAQRLKVEKGMEIQIGALDL
ncbi:hypothetical protein MVEN_01001200 [Mycena venus]|uniref:F-box domain-containing protein n=1 Tax=Mycena venus TaxID=2733690 RepID=A0A8H7D257_9AGAR|nr:hypothetical protein MVEN_01001200 [Mycena venus]